MEKKELLNRITSFIEIIHKIDVLENFFNKCKSMLDLELNSINHKYKNELFVVNQIDNLLNNLQNLNDKEINKIENLNLNDKKISNYVKLFLDKNKKNKKILRVEVNSDFKLFEAKRCKEDYKIQLNFLYTTILDRIVSIFEENLSSIYLKFLFDYPETYFSNQNVSVLELLNRKDGNPILNVYLKEIDLKMRGCTLELLDDLIDKNNISKNMFNLDYDIFKEIYYRRNIYVHNKGYVNNDYLRYVKNSSFKSGEKIECDSDYFKKGFSAFSKLLVSLEFYFSQKLKMDNKLSEYLGNYGFECLRNKKYDIAEHTYNLLKCYDNIEYADKLMFVINYLNAKKQQGKEIDIELKKLDVSACTDNFKIAKLCLENRFKDVFVMLSKTYPDSFDATQIKNWPIFINFRENDLYKKFIDNHKKDFKIDISNL